MVHKIKKEEENSYGFDQIAKWQDEWQKDYFKMEGTDEEEPEDAGGEKDKIEEKEDENMVSQKKHIRHSKYGRPFIAGRRVTFYATTSRGKRKKITFIARKPLR